MIQTLRTLALAASLSLGMLAPAAASGYVAANGPGNRIDFLDDAMAPQRSFAVADPFPNAVTATHTLIFAGYFLEASVVAYDHAGNEQFRWSDFGLGRLTGLAAVDDFIAATADDTLYLFDAGTGRYIQQLTLDDSVEGLAYDPARRYLWTIGADIVARDFDSGSVVRRLPNAAIGCPFSGTGIALSGSDALMLGCADGHWFRVSDLDGAVIEAGSNGLEMYDLAALPAPELPTPVLTLSGLLVLGAAARGRRAWCRLSDSNG